MATNRVVGGEAWTVGTRVAFAQVASDQWDHEADDPEATKQNWREIAMKRTVLSLLIGGVIASGLVFAAPSTAKADHRRSVGVYVGSGGFAVGVGYGSPYRYSYFAPARPVVVRPVVVPSCCHYERVYVPPSWDAWGGWHPGFYQTVRVCDHHGRVVVY
jgi:hypothetical protein